jgi:hypothetical protein
MIITITGTKSEKRKGLLTAATKFYAHLLLPKRTVECLNVEVILNPKLKDYGYCMSDGDDRSPKEFQIELQTGRDRNDEDLFKTLAHEMVHLKQYAKNELKASLAVKQVGNTMTFGTTWMGEIYEFTKSQHGYWDAPWEIEAYGRELGMYIRWCEHLEGIKRCK